VASQAFVLLTVVMPCGNHLFFSFLGWSGTESAITGVTTGLFYRPRMMDDERGAIGEMFVRGNRSTRSKPAQRRAVHHKFHMT
jgi:hypothetical protein